MKKMYSLLILAAFIGALASCAMPGTENQQENVSLSADGKTFSLTGDVNTSVYDGQKVKLVSAMSAVGSYNGPYQNASFTVLVKNENFDKNVIIHLNNGGEEWLDIKASYESPARNGYEIWKAYYAGSFGSTEDLTFAVKYEVSGQEYWDNNNGNDYFLGKNDGVFLNDDIYLLNYTSYDRFYAYKDQVFLDIDVAVLNLAYDKEIIIVYTTDNWQTQNEISAEFAPYWSPVRGSITSPNAHNVEMWSVNSYIYGVPKEAEEFKYYIAYTVNGTTYFDNNFGQDYSAEIYHSVY